MHLQYQKIHYSFGKFYFQNVSGISGKLYLCQSLNGILNGNGLKVSKLGIIKSFETRDNKFQAILYIGTNKNHTT